jgi:hypothetical protein
MRSSDPFNRAVEALTRTGPISRGRATSTSAINSRAAISVFPLLGRTQPGSWSDYHKRLGRGVIPSGRCTTLFGLYAVAGTESGESEPTVNVKELRGSSSASTRRMSRAAPYGRRHGLSL